MTRAILFVVILCFISKAFSKQFSECELVAELRKQGFPENQMQDWLCLINKGSLRKTNAVGFSDIDELIHFYGLFQIMEFEWCSTDEEPNIGCYVNCNDLLQDDITIASNCAKQIVAKYGFDNWDFWVDKCKGRVHPKINC